MRQHCPKNVTPGAWLIMETVQVCGKRGLLPVALAFSLNDAESTRGKILSGGVGGGGGGAHAGSHGRGHPCRCILEDQAVRRGRWGIESFGSFKEYVGRWLAD